MDGVKQTLERLREVLNSRLKIKLWEDLPRITAIMTAASDSISAAIVELDRLGGHYKSLQE